MPGKRPEGAAARKFDSGPGGGNRCADSGVGGGDEVLSEGAVCDRVAGSAAPAGGVLGTAEEGGARGSEVFCGDEELAAAAVAGVRNASFWTRPFDLVVLDLGSLGGLNFAQKLVRR